MAFGPERNTVIARQAQEAVIDVGLRQYMLGVYNYMASGILLSGIVALLFAFSGVAGQVMTTPLRWVIALAPLGFVFAMSFGVQRMKASTLQLLFWLFSVAMGLSLSAIFLVYTGPSIAVTFLATAASLPQPARTPPKMA